MDNIRNIPSHPIEKANLSGPSANELLLNNNHLNGKDDRKVSMKRTKDEMSKSSIDNSVALNKKIVYHTNETSHEAKPKKLQYIGIIPGSSLPSSQLAAPFVPPIPMATPHFLPWGGAPLLTHRNVPSSHIAATIGQSLNDVGRLNDPRPPRGSIQPPSSEYLIPQSIFIHPYDFGGGQFVGLNQSYPPAFHPYPTIVYPMMAPQSQEKRNKQKSSTVRPPSSEEALKYSKESSEIVSPSIDGNILKLKVSQESDQSLKPEKVQDTQDPWKQDILQNDHQKPEQNTAPLSSNVIDSNSLKPNSPSAVPPKQHYAKPTEVSKVEDSSKPPEQRPTKINGSISTTISQNQGDHSLELGFLTKEKSRMKKLLCPGTFPAQQNFNPTHLGLICLESNKKVLQEAKVRELLDNFQFELDNLNVKTTNFQDQAFSTELIRQLIKEEQQNLGLNEMTIQHPSFDTVLSKLGEIFVLELTIRALGQQEQSLTTVTNSFTEAEKFRLTREHVLEVLKSIDYYDLFLDHF